MKKKRYVVVNQERWERFNVILGLAMLYGLLAIIEHFLGPCYR